MVYDVIRELTSKEIPLYIWGSGEIGKLINKRLGEMGVPVAGYITDEKKWGGVEINELPYASNGYAVIRGWLGAFYLSDDDIRSRFPGCRYPVTITDMYEPDVTQTIDDLFYAEHKERFDKAYGTLADKLSRETFTAYLQSKIYKNVNTLIPLVIPTQYFFDNSPWEYFDDEIIVDCGAYNGDSIRDYISLRGKRYQEIIAFEPDPRNYEKLCLWIKESGENRIIPIAAGVYKETADLSFQESGDMEACFSSTGDARIHVESIDNVLYKKRVSIIKMDIEGMELEALKGARATIEQNEPLLMISAYHKRDDLYMLTDYISNISKNYVFFLRAHKPLPLDMVLYAVPGERIRNT